MPAGTPNDIPGDIPEDIWIEVGRVLGAFGIRGWVRIESFTEPPAGIFEYPSWRLHGRGGRRPTRVEESRPHGRRFVVRLPDCNDRDSAARLAGDTIEVLRSELRPLGEREFYRADLIGMSVRRVNGELLGTVGYFIETAASAIMVVKGEREHWVPATALHLRRVDLTARTVWVDWVEALGKPGK